VYHPVGHEEHEGTPSVYAYVPKKTSILLINRKKIEKKIFVYI
jgi:hypothetical protein